MPRQIGQRRLEKIMRDHNDWLSGKRNGILKAGKLAFLHNENFSCMSLTCWNFSQAAMYKADLSCCDLSYANLSYARLYGANLNHADLSNANLTGVCLREANLDGAILPDRDIPVEGCFEGWKTAVTKKGRSVIKIFIPKDAERVQTIGSDRCRCSKAKAIEIPNDCDEAFSSWDTSFKYPLGVMVKANFNSDPRQPYGAGIHFFLTEEEARRF
jgi:hypothetical protein